MPSASTRCEFVAFLLGSLSQVFIPFILKWAEFFPAGPRVDTLKSVGSPEGSEGWEGGQEKGAQLNHTTLNPLLHACGLTTVDGLQETLEP